MRHVTSERIIHPGVEMIQNIKYFTVDYYYKPATQRCAPLHYITAAASFLVYMSDAAAAAPVKAAALPPGDFVRGVVGRPVVVRLSTGSDYRGILVCLDGFMNIALEHAEEYTDGVLVSKLGDCFLRGNKGEPHC
jgi:U6 snRNA-associated Sm-like protein LSm6